MNGHIEFDQQQLRGLLEEFGQEGHIYVVGGGCNLAVDERQADDQGPIMDIPGPRLGHAYNTKTVRFIDRVQVG